MVAAGSGKIADYELHIARVRKQRLLKRACVRHFCSLLLQNGQKLLNFKPLVYVLVVYWLLYMLLLSFRIILGDGGSSVGSGPLMSPGLWKTPASSAGAGQSTVMAELTNLVNAHPRAGMQAGKDQMLT